MCRLHNTSNIPLMVASVQATASGDQTVRLWNAETQTCAGTLAGHTCTIKSVSWDPHNPSPSFPSSCVTGFS